MNKNNPKLFLLVLLFPISLKINAQERPYQHFRANVELEELLFLNHGLYERQKQNYFSLAFRSEYSINWNKGRSLFKTSLFGRYDQHDKTRNHIDISELYWQMVRGNHELSLGLKEIFWGVTEAAQLVNVINQSSYTESFDGKTKLGQPMVHYSLVESVGTFDLFMLPYFRVPAFPGEKGRLRSPFVIDEKNIPFESKLKRLQPDFAFRWSHYFGKLDIGISHFYGTGRQPLISDLGKFDLVFALVNQSAIELQATTGSLLWKLEAINNANKIKNYRALAVGFEYTLANVRGSGLDIGLLGEYLYDSRDHLALNSLQNDVFTGARLAFNDKNDIQLLVGTVLDLQNGSQMISFEGNRRFGESWTIEIEGRFFDNISPEEFMFFMRRDGFLKFSIKKYL
jgi:hypothetical protein